MTAIPTLITTSESSVLPGQVMVDGRPAEGVTVVFSLAPPSAGTVNPSVTITDDSGEFTASFIPSNQNDLEFVFVTASLPHFPRTTATALFQLLAKTMSDKRQLIISVWCFLYSNLPLLC